MSGYYQGNQEFTNATPPGGTPKITSIFDFSAEALGQLKVWFEQAGLNIPISNILGFSQFNAKVAPFILTNETTTSATYGNLATIGPQITGLPAGKYIVAYGAASAAAGGFAKMVVQVNQDPPIDNDAAINGSTSTIAVSIIVAKTLTESNNSLTCVYSSHDGTSVVGFSRRWLIALRYANK